MELSEQLPPRYEERMVSAQIDCDAGRGDAGACHAVGEFLAVIKKDYANARTAYMQNCADRGHGASCFGVGRLLLAGRGGAADETGAEAAFRKGCELGHAPSCHNLGLLAFRRKDDAAALECLEKACEGGHPASCHALGGYFLRAGPKRDPVVARARLEAACDDGHAPACHNLAVMFKKGDAGVPADQKLFDRYAKRTRALVDAAGAARGVRVA